MTDLERAKAVAVELGIDEPGVDPDAAILAQDFGVSGTPAVPERGLEIIENEILFYKRQAGQSIIEIGKRLNEAKAQLNHGEWLPWLREKVDISERSAQDFMRLAREYSKSAEIADLGATKALALLALPVSERGDFVAEKHPVDGVEKSVHEMTTKELKQAIRERDEARREAEVAKAETEAAEEARAKMEADMRQLKELQERAREAEEQKAEELRRVEAELEELRKKPVDVAVEKVQDPEAIAEARAAGAAEEAMKQQAALTAKEDQLKKLKEDLKKAREEAKAANINLQTAEKEAREARKQAEQAGKMAQVNSNQNMVKFSVLFQQAQDTVNQMADALGKETAENQGKMRAALGALAQAIQKVAG